MSVQKPEQPIVAAPSAGREPLLTTKDVAALMGMSEQWLRDHSSRKKPRLPVVRIGGKGGRLRFRREAIEEFVRQLEIMTDSLEEQARAFAAKTANPKK